VWSDPVLIVGAVACIAGVVAALYAYLPYRANTRAASQRQFVNERRYLGENRSMLTAMALSAKNSLVLTGLPGMLSQEEWISSDLIPIGQISVDLNWEEPPDFDTHLRRSASKMLPRAEPSGRFPNYSAALGELARPSLFQDLPCYRLLSARLNQNGGAHIRVGMTSFFRGIDESEAVAHEFARASKARRGFARNKSLPSKLPIRTAVGNPFSSYERNMIFSISALTLRVDGATAKFFLHSRDSKAVAIAGNLLHLAPSGVFQPTSDDRQIARRDCSPWLTLCREYAEEFLGVEEAQGAAGVALSYTHDQPYAAINNAYEDGSFRVLVCGIGLDPLTLCPELVAISCIDASVFDSLFHDLVVRNSEGFIRGKEMRAGRVVGYDFSSQTVSDLLASKRLSPAAYAALSRAWKLRPTFM